MALVRAKKETGAQIPLLVIENVVGAVTSNGGRDFEAIAEALTTAGYRHGSLIIDAKLFVPHSRPRLFIVAAASSVPIPPALTSDVPGCWYTKSLLAAHEQLSPNVRRSTLCWALPLPKDPVKRLADLLEREPTNVQWHTKEQTDKLLDLMSPVNQQKVREAQTTGRTEVGTVYKRTRTENGRSRQRAEVRFDSVSGCLRTPAGGSSRQIVLVVEGPRVRSRLLSPREAARLMGIDDDYALPGNYNEAYKLMGDGVVVPAVRWLSRHLLTPLAKVGAPRGATASVREVA